MSLMSNLFKDVLRCWTIYKDELKNPRYEYIKDREITWHKREPLTGHESYNDYYDQIVEKMQFSFECVNNSKIQAYYYVEKELLERASLAFIPYPENDPIGASYIRFDCNLKEHNNFYHAAYHIHFGYNSQIRINLFRFPKLSEFFLFIKHTVFHEEIEAKKIMPVIKTLDDLKLTYYHSLRIFPDK